MIGIPKVSLIKSLHFLQRSQCQYDLFVVESRSKPPEFCDCKYGFVGNVGYGEQTACPELRLVVELLEKMTEEEYEELCKRANVI